MQLRCCRQRCHRTDCPHAARHRANPATPGSGAPAMTEFKRIPPEQAQALREQGAVLVDVRDAQAFQSNHIPDSLHLDNQSIADFIREADLDKPLVVVCYHGNSSQSAAAYLVGQGFSDVYSVDGGFELWRATYPSETAQG
ncbi:Thiosulfate sulfurtransferase GlpE [Pseudomonas coronafaciens pv. porri]|uniref:Thiosulfate sulfurtransferase GlpE n=4 Tax=Pseudomonas syringae group TaxID=136849 RepID=A0AB37QNU8_9PSED|nr:Thiosulfate sulfurtransferase GlpE [Pseudomonas coronafaciens pv. garcae]RMU83819.1 Thiosulfate sulfurtransferase GlpE [Pseudomonas coronafaciens pv. porri]